MVVVEERRTKTFRSTGCTIFSNTTPPEAQNSCPNPPTLPVPLNEKTQSKSGEGFPVAAPMPGSIIDIKVNIGDDVNEGDVLLLLEAMKMENEVTAPAPGYQINSYSKGASVNTGDIMVVIE